MRKPQVLDKHKKQVQMARLKQALRRVIAFKRQTCCLLQAFSDKLHIGIFCKAFEGNEGFEGVLWKEVFHCQRQRGKKVK